jgi:hypothetical protein
MSNFHTTNHSHGTSYMNRMFLEPITNTVSRIRSSSSMKYLSSSSYPNAMLHHSNSNNSNNANNTNTIIGSSPNTTNTMTMITNHNNSSNANNNNSNSTGSSMVAAGGMISNSLSAASNNNNPQNNSQLHPSLRHLHPANMTFVHPTSSSVQESLGGGGGGNRNRVNSNTSSNGSELGGNISPLSNNSPVIRSGRKQFNNNSNNPVFNQQLDMSKVNSRNRTPPIFTVPYKNPDLV